MPLQYIIDGYNIINNPLLIQHKKEENGIPNGIKDSRTMLLEFIRRNRLCGSSKNSVTVVFDGYPVSLEFSYADKNIHIIFSRKISADEKIKRMVEELTNRKNIVVVSDDKEIRFMVKSLGARIMRIEEFVNAKEKSRLKKEKDLIKPELSYSQIDKINEELRQIWLK